MMMVQDSKLSNQCKHNNTGFCKFRDHCKFQHFDLICPKNVCRNADCRKRHPKTCRFGTSCKFNYKNACAYKHAKDLSQETFQSETRVLQEEIKTLQTNISELKKSVQLKEKELKEKIKEVRELNELLDHEKDISNETITKKEEVNNEKSKKIIELEKENEYLKKQNAKMSERVNVLKSEFKCKKCTFDAETNTRVNNHLTGNQ